MTTETGSSFEVFISHASEDKHFVRPLADALERAGVRVWYDENVLRAGDSLSRSIDRGLANARFGIVVLSRAFFQKAWPEYELRGLIAREIGGERLMIPLWHDITREDVLKFSPPLADTKALTTDMSIESLVSAILGVIRSDEHSAWLIGTVGIALEQLDDTEFHGYGYDYWPEGGLRSVYDHLQTFASFAQVARAFGKPVFLSGPHSATHLDLNSQDDFGRYNPDFIAWVASNIRFVLGQHRLVAAASKKFDEYLLYPAALFYETYRVLHANPDVNDLLLQDYKRVILSGSAPPQYYWRITWSISDPECPARVKKMMALLSRYDVNTVSTAIYFWLRRQLDGTEAAIFSLLVDVLKAFSPANYANIGVFSNWRIDGDGEVTTDRTHDRG